MAGASEVERRLRAIAAEERLLKTTAYELLTIPELRVSGPALVQELAHLLRGALT